MIFFKILLTIFVVVDIGLVVPETIQTKYNSTHSITHPGGRLLDFRVDQKNETTIISDLEV